MNAACNHQDIGICAECGVKAARLASDVRSVAAEIFGDQMGRPVRAILIPEPVAFDLIHALDVIRQNYTGDEWLVKRTTSLLREYATWVLVNESEVGESIMEHASPAIWAQVLAEYRIPREGGAPEEVSP